MKSGTPNHIKTKRLKRRLRLPMFQIAGILEMLWQLTGDCTDDGGVGRYSNEDIAAYIEWEGDHDDLINALVDCGWLDHDENDRLVVHDWEEHAPGYIKERIQKRGWRRKQRTCDKTSPDSPEEEPDSPAEIPYVRTQAKQSQPNQGKPNPTQGRQSQANQTQANQEKDSASAESRSAEAEPIAGDSEATDAAEQVRAVFAHYRTHHPQAFPKPRSDSKEWRLVRRRLADGFTVDQLCAAIDGCHRSPWHCGENPGGKLYQNLELILRDATHVNQFLEVPQRGQGPPVLSERTQRNKRAADSYLERRLSEINGHEQTQRPAGIRDGAASPGGDVRT